MNKIEIWLYRTNDMWSTRFPVNPPDLTVDCDSMNETINLSDIGETTIIKQAGLKTIKFASFFPATYGAYMKGWQWYPPLNYVQWIEDFRNLKIPLQLVVTGMNITIPVTIERFSYSERGGDVGTIYYDIEFKEFRATRPNIISTSKVRYWTNSELRPEPIDNYQSKNYYTTRSGDTMVSIALSVYGDETKVETIGKANGISFPYTINPGTKLVLP